MKLIKKLIAVVVLLFAAQQVTYAQNWGFSLPFGAGGFAINGKNWVAGLNGISAGGGRGGWGFGLPNGAGFYNGGGGGCGGGYGGGYVGGCAVSRGGYPNAVPHGAVFIPNQAPPGVFGGYGPGQSRGYARRNYPTAYTSGWVAYPNVW